MARKRRMIQYKEVATGFDTGILLGLSMRVFISSRFSLQATLLPVPVEQKEHVAIRIAKVSIFAHYP